MSSERGVDAGLRISRPIFTDPKVIVPVERRSACREQGDRDNRRQQRAARGR